VILQEEVGDSKLSEICPTLFLRDACTEAPGCVQLCSFPVHRRPTQTSRKVSRLASQMTVSAAAASSRSTCAPAGATKSAQPTTAQHNTHTHTDRRRWQRGDGTITSSTALHTATANPPTLSRSQ